MGIFTFLGRKLLYFFLGLGDYSDKFAVRAVNDKIYFLQEPKTSASAVALLQYDIKYLKYLPPQSLASIENKKMK